VAIDIAFTADTSKVVKETKNIGDALEKVADELEDTGKDAKDLDTKVSAAFKSMSKDADTAADKMDDSLSGTFRQMGQDAKRAGDDIGREVKSGTDKAGEGLEEMKAESAGTAREAAASFGSIEDSADVLQEVLANAFAGFGPAGMAAGIAAAAGIGLLFSELQGSAEKINENKERMLNLAQTIRDNGGVLTDADYVTQMEEYGYAIQDTKEWWELFQADAVSGFEQLRDLAKETGMSTRDIFRAGFGNKDEAKKTLDDVNKRLEELKGKKEALFNMNGSIISAPEAEELSALERTKTLIEDNIRAQEDAAMVDRIRWEGLNSLTDATIDEAEALRNAGESKKEAAANEAELARYVQGTTEHFRDQADAIEEATDAIKGSITSQLDYMDSVDDLAKKLKDNSNAWDENTAKGRENQRAVIDVAGGIEEMARAALDAGAPVADVTAKFQAQKDALVTQVMPAFGGSREAAQAYIDTILKTPPVAKTRVELDKEEAERRLKELQSPRGIPMHISGVDGSAVENYFMSQQGRKIFVEFAPRGGGQAIAMP
jgi:ABC-type transporter Mla subunit MlaD